MNNKPDFFDYDSQAFFGKVNASISHELKNIMAIISETAGLLSDLSQMAQEGQAIQLDMLTQSTESIIEEIQRGFTTIRQMNRFSHSIDTPVASSDLLKMLDLICHLTGYLSFAGKIHIHPVDGDTPEVMTCPFILQAVLYEILARGFKHTGPNTEIDVFLKAGEDTAWQIIFDGFNNEVIPLLPNDQINRMASSIGVSIHCDPSLSRLMIRVPERLKTPARIDSSSNTR